MKKRLALLTLAVLLAVSLLSGCKAKTITTGSFDTLNYHNDFFGLTLKMPDGWSIATRDQIKDAYGVTDAAVGSDNRSTEKSLNIASQPKLYLGLATKHAYGYTESFNANITMSCENLALEGITVTKPEDYLKLTQQMSLSSLQTSGIDTQMHFGDTTTQTIGGAPFAVNDCTVTMSGLSFNQRQLVTLQKGYALIFTLTWNDNSELAEMQNTVNSIAIK